MIIFLRFLWSHIPLRPALGSQRQEDGEVEVSLGYSRVIDQCDLCSMTVFKNYFTNLLSHWLSSPVIVGLLVRFRHLFWFRINDWIHGKQSTLRWIFTSILYFSPFIWREEAKGLTQTTQVCPFKHIWSPSYWGEIKSGSLLVWDNGLYSVNYILSKCYWPVSRQEV